MHQRILFCLIFLFSSLISRAQGADSILITNTPLIKGTLFLFRENHISIQDPLPVLFIYSDSLTVFSPDSGFVKNIFKQDGFLTVIIQTPSDYKAYGHLTSVKPKIGVYVHKNEVIGKIGCEDNECYLIFELLDNKLRSNYYDEIDYLKKCNEKK